MTSTFAVTAILSYSMHLVMHLLVFPLVSLRDTDAPTNVPTTVEYNNQTNSIIGIISYATAFWFLLLTDLTDPTTKWITSVCNWTPQYLALTLTGCYEYNGYVFRNCYCQPDTRNSFERIIQEASFSIYLASLLMLSFVPSIEQYNSTVTVSASVFFAYRFIMILSDYRRSVTAKTLTYPEQTLMTIGVHNDYPTKSVVEPTATRTNVWKMYGHEYDVTDFVQHHPGGVESIMLAANRDDATALFQSYHAFNIHKAKAVLEKYRVSKSSSLEEEKKLQGTYPVGHHNDLLYEELVKRVSKKLIDNGIDPVKDRCASWTRYVLYCLLISALVASGYFHVKGNPFGSLFLGFWGSFLGAHIGHDGGHYAISKFAWINDILVWCMSFISNPIVWQHQHTYAHHSFTNLHDRDPDLHHFSLFMRYNTIQKLLPQYKLQMFAFYIFWAFGFTSNGTLYWNLWRFIFERSIHGTVAWTDRKRWYRTALLIFHMFAHPVCNFVIPYWYHRNLMNAIICGAIQMTTAGFLFALVSQVGHITEMALARDTVTSQKSRAAIAKGSWAAEQVETTNDFCPDSNIMMFFGGNLNVQIEHHLFPSLNHCHLQLIQPTVEETCVEYGVSYKKYDGWSDAMSDTIAYLQKLSVENPDCLNKQQHASVKKIE